MAKIKFSQSLGFFLIRLGGRIALGKPVQASLTVSPPMVRKNTETIEEYRVTYANSDMADTFPTRAEAEEWMSKWHDGTLHRRTVANTVEVSAWEEV